MNDNISTESESIPNENLEKLRSVFPQFVRDGQIDFDALKAFFDAEAELAGTEKYGLNWVGKSNAFRAIRTPATGTLVPEPEESKNWDSTENLFIEGDNLEVLKLLQKHYREKIKMIYIDPPYNTGKDFVYKDNFTQGVADYYEQTGQTRDGIKMTANTEKNGRYHSDWLTMMYPRLFLARNLLKEDGVIFVSIDDNEVANLRLVMDEIFGEENYLKIISRITGTPTGGGNEAFVNEVDYVLVYSKSPNHSIKGLELSENEEAIYDKEDERGKYLIRSLRRTGGEDRREDRPTMFFPIEAPDKTLVYPHGPGGYESRWICGKEKYTELHASGLIEWVLNKGSYFPYQKFYLEGRLKQPSNLWKSSEGNKKATRDVKSFFEGIKVFDFPKPVGLISDFIKVIASDDLDFTILDFFAGSGTTAHAVMDLNVQDGGNRKFICVQLPEKTDEESEACKAGYKTISQITRERIRRAGDKIVEEHKDKEGIDTLDIGFKSYTLSNSSYRKWNTVTEEDPQALIGQMKLFAEKPLVDNFDQRSVVYEVLLKEGYSLNSSVEVIPVGKDSAPWEYYKVVDSEDNQKIMIVTFANKVVQSDIDKLDTKSLDLFVCFDNALDDTTKVNVGRGVNVKTI